MQRYAMSERVLGPALVKHVEGEWVRFADVATLTAELAEARAALASRTEDLVWAVVHGAELDGDRIWWFRQLNEGSGDVDIECDGTPASIAAAVEKARKSDRPE
jgi:hypothetical protein